MYNGLTQWLKDNSHISILLLSEFVEYPWPRELLKQQSTPKPFNDIAESILKAKNERNTFAAKRLLDRWYLPEEEVWTARFSLASSQWSEGVAISRWLHTNGGYTFGTGSAESIPLKQGEEDQWFSKIHPKVWLGFADQIESGKTWEILHEDLKW